METTEALRADVAAGSGYKWTPGKWGRRLFTKSDWQAVIDETHLYIDGEALPVDRIRSVHIRRGVVWARVSIQLDDSSAKLLKGLTNRNGKKFVAWLTASCVLSAVERLRELVSIADTRQRLWQEKTNAPRWIAGSDVSKFVSGCPASPPDSKKRFFLEGDFAKSALNYISPAQTAILTYLYGGDVASGYEQRNQQFLREESARFSEYFETIEKNPLTDEQIEAVITFDDNVMTVAAAGSGKTSVLIAKAGYAVTSGLFQPEEIVLLAFNRKAAKELAQRISKRLGPRIEGADRIKVATFHSLGLDVISEATGKRPMVASWIEQGRELAELADIVRVLSKKRRFAKKWNLFRTVYAQSLPPFGAEEEPEWWDEKTGVLGFRTARGETVKSQEERMICNWLAEEGVDYEYERQYEHDTATKTHRQYIPDFYYPSASVYHEHFALDENGVPPRRFTGYADGVDWKRALHAEQATLSIKRQPDGTWVMTGLKAACNQSVAQTTSQAVRQWLNPV